MEHGDAPGPVARLRQLHRVRLLQSLPALAVASTQKKAVLWEWMSPRFGPSGVDARRYTQLDRDGDGGETCYFPQIEALDSIHAYHPNATFVLNIRSVELWYQSVSSWKRSWGGLQDRLVQCDISALCQQVWETAPSSSGGTRHI